MSEPSSATRERIARVCQGIGCALDAAAEQALGDWLAELRAWNRKINLTAARGEDELCDLMLADAALFARELARAAPGSAPLTLVDVGSGAGAPGLALAILRPDLRVCLCEPLHKRTAFLRSVAGKLALVPPRLEIVAARVEALGARRFAIATSRATLAPEAWLRAGSALAPEVWLLLAREEAPLVPGLALDRDCHYRWPLTGAERRAVRFVASPA